MNIKCGIYVHYDIYHKNLISTVINVHKLIEFFIKLIPLRRFA